MLRPMRSVALSPLALLLLSTVSGCAYGELSQVLRTQVASEADCPEILVTKKGLKYFDEDPETDQYMVSGCGMLRTYTCPAADGLIKYGSEPCTFVEGDPDRPVMKAPEPMTEGDPFGDGAPSLDDEPPAYDADSDSDETSDES
jgi:hypothetical protein